MWLFLRQIPKGTTREKLGEFVSKGLNPSWMLFRLPARAKIKRCEILQIFNPDTESTEYHGLVLIDPSKEVPPMIERLNGRKLQGKPIEVRKYFRRSSDRDRRRTLSEREEGSEIRRQDRRRQRLRSTVLRAPEVQRTLGIL